MKKISLSEMKSLSRNEMKKIMAGSGDAGRCGYPSACSVGTYCVYACGNGYNAIGQCRMSYYSNCFCAYAC